MEKGCVSFFENLYYRPRWFHWIFAFLFLPLSLCYGGMMWLRRRLVRPHSLGVPVVSVGNLIIGGSGKTPMTIALAKACAESAVVLRGYGRKSEGLQIVSRWGERLCDVACAGDEAILLAKKLPNACVIVAEDRREGIKKAKEMGAKVVFLDDGFSKVAIEKFDILLFPKKILNPFPLPSGPFREFWFEKAHADLVLKEERDFKRVVRCDGCDRPMLLVTAIANPERLEPYLPHDLIKGRYLLPDHAWFDQEAIRERMRKIGVSKILTTEKDWVKLENSGLDTAILKLDLKLNESIVQSVCRYRQFASM